MPNLTPTTELDAINIMLRWVDEQPVDAISGSISESSIAQDLLHETSREVQSNGLRCNSLFDQTITADVSGFFNLPSEYLFIDTVDRTIPVCQRGLKLFDLKNNTDIFTETTLRVDIIIFLTFTDLPEHVRRWITMLATEQFIVTELGEDNVSRKFEQAKNRAKLAFLRNERKGKDSSLLTALDTFQMVNRRFNPVRI